MLRNYRDDRDRQRNDLRRVGDLQEVVRRPEMLLRKREECGIEGDASDRRCAIPDNDRGDRPVSTPECQSADRQGQSDLEVPGDRVVVQRIAEGERLRRVRERAIERNVGRDGAACSRTPRDTCRSRCPIAAPSTTARPGLADRYRQDRLGSTVRAHRPARTGRRVRAPSHPEPHTSTDTRAASSAAATKSDDTTATAISLTAITAEVSQNLDQDRRETALKGPRIGRSLGFVFERFTDRARRVVVLAQEEARVLGHDYIGTEHILLGLIHEGEGIAATALESLEISWSDARAQIEEIIGHGRGAPSGHIPFTPRAKKVLEFSLRESLQLGANSIGTEHVLLGLIREGEGVAAQVLVNLAGDLARVRQRVIEMVSNEGSPAGVLGVRAVTTEQRPPFAYESAARSIPTCSFCQRDLWEVAHYATGPGAFICDVCIIEAHHALDRAATDEHVLRLPPRVFLAPPEDDPGALDAIVDAVTAVFGADLTERSAAFVEDGEQVVPVIIATRARHNARVTDVLVHRVRFSASDSAAIRFEMILENRGRFPLEGTVVRVGERWLVTRETVAAALQPAGVSLPPPK